MLRVNGVKVEIAGDDLIVEGKGHVAGAMGLSPPHGSSHRDVGTGDGACRRQARKKSTTPPLSSPHFRISSDDAPHWGRSSHDHRHRRTGRIRQGHARKRLAITTVIVTSIPA